MDLATQGPFSVTLTVIAKVVVNGLEYSDNATYTLVYQNSCSIVSCTYVVNSLPRVSVKLGVFDTQSFALTDIFTNDHASGPDYCADFTVYNFYDEPGTISDPPDEVELFSVATDTAGTHIMSCVLTEAHLECEQDPDNTVEEEFRVFMRMSVMISGEEAQGVYHDFIAAVERCKVVEIAANWFTDLETVQVNQQTW